MNNLSSNSSPQQNEVLNMMENRPVFIHFVLDPQQDSAGRRNELRLVHMEFSEEEIPYSFSEVNDCTELAALLEEDPSRNRIVRKQSEPGAVPAEAELCITDSDRIFQKLTEMNRPAAAYRHAGNESQRFEKAEWIVEEPQYVDRDSYRKIWQRLTGNPWTIAVTDRLWIREMTEEDLDGLYRLYDDPGAKRFLTPPLPDREKERCILRAYIRKVYGLYGYGMWAVCDRRTGELIGRVGFEPYLGRNRAVELGYLIRADRREQGLAAEAARAAIRFADENLDFPAIAIRTNADNTASIRLAQSLGFVGAAVPDSELVDRRKNGDDRNHGEENVMPVDAGKSSGIRYFIREK